MSINVTQLKNYIVEPILTYLDKCSPSAINLVLGTAAQESQMGTYIKQIGFNIDIAGGGLGIYQCEFKTAIDNIKYIYSHEAELFKFLSALYTGGDLDVFVKSNISSDTAKCLAYNLVGNLLFATAMCRIHYFIIKEKLPVYNDIAGLAAYWKKYYNTKLGKGTEEEFVNNYKKYVGE